MLCLGVGVDGSPESAAALAAAVPLAVALDAEMEIIRAYSARGLPPDAALLVDLSADARRQLAEAAATGDQGVSVHPILVLGSAASALAECSRDLDLLLVGSRGYEPARSVALGGVSGRLIRRAACPVIVTPRGVANLLEALFSASCVSSSSRRSPASAAIPGSVGSQNDSVR
jgi:nucleotide-binding universal stress UspA family protein